MFGKALGAATGAASAAAGAASAAAGKKDDPAVVDPEAGGENATDSSVRQNAGGAAASQDDIKPGVEAAAEANQGSPSGNSTPLPEAEVVSPAKESQESSGGGMLGKGMGFASKAASVAGSAGGSAAGSAMTAAKAAGDVAAPMAADAATKGAAMAVEGAKVGAEMGVEAAKMAKEEAEKAAKAAADWAKEMYAKFKLMVEKWVKLKIHEMAGKALDRIPPVAKGCLEDPEMPRCVSRGKDRLVDSVWPHIREEVMYEVAVMLDGKADRVQNPDDGKGVDCFRAFIRYHMFPFDKGIWAKLRDPVFWALTLISCIPIAGVGPLFFVFLFFIIDKSDEFQLIQFILRFKGTQFLAQGILKAFIGFYGYVGCVSSHAGVSHHSCDVAGPGVLGAAGVIGMFGYILTVILIWVAFFLLPCSKEKGRVQLAGIIQENEGQAIVKRKGGVIIYLLFWDLFIFVLCGAACGYVATTRKNFKLDDWAFATTIFAAQIVYGLFSFPFFFFTIPGLQRALAHTLPTAYDRTGRCRAPKKPDVKKEDKVEPVKQSMTEEAEVAELWGRLRAKAGIPGM